MSICDLYAGWDTTFASSERFVALSGLINDVLDHWGFDGVEVFDQHPPAPNEDSPAVYHRDEEAIYLNPDYFQDFDAFEGLYVALHEAIHAAIHQLGWNMNDIEEELEAAAQGWAAVEAMLAECQSLLAESGAAPNLPDYPWFSPAP